MKLKIAWNKPILSFCETVNDEERSFKNNYTVKNVLTTLVDNFSVSNEKKTNLSVKKMSYKRLKRFCR